GRPLRQGRHRIGARRARHAAARRARPLRGRPLSAGRRSAGEPDRRGVPARVRRRRVAALPREGRRHRDAARPLRRARPSMSRPRARATAVGMRATSVALLLLARATNFAAGQSEPPAAPAEKVDEESHKFWSEEDGNFDVSGFLDEKYGFLPIVLPITEP